MEEEGLVNIAKAYMAGNSADDFLQSSADRRMRSDKRMLFANQELRRNAPGLARLYEGEGLKGIPGTDRFDRSVSRFQSSRARGMLTPWQARHERSFTRPVSSMVGASRPVRPMNFWQKVARLVARRGR